MFDRLSCVVREAGDVPAVGNDLRFCPGQKHLAVLGNFVLPFVGGGEVIGIDVFQPDENAAHPGPRTFLDKIRQLVAKRVDLDEEAELQFVDFFQMNDPVEDRFPVLISGKVIVGNKEAAQSLLDVLANDLLDVVRRAASRLASLDIDDRAERTLKRATASGVETGHMAGGSLGADGGDKPERDSIDA